MERGRYDDHHDATLPTGVSFLLFFLAVVALCIAVMYLQASTLHEREIKISAYEETIAEWASFRSTFARLSVNVTAHFGVAPVNTTDPGLDTNPAPPGTPLPLTPSEEADPIYDEEGEAGGLPQYEPLMFDKGVAPPPWRTARRFPPPEEEPPDDSDEENSEENSAAEGDGAGEDGAEGSGDGDGGDGGQEDGGGGRRRDRRRRRMTRGRGRLLLQGGGGDEAAPLSALGLSSPAPPVPPPPLLLPVPPPSHPSRRFAEEASGGTGEGDGSGDGKGGGEEEEEEVGLPPGVIPEVPFEGAPSVRFVFSARLDPAPERRPGRNKGGKGTTGGKGKGDKGKRRLLEELQRRDLKAVGGGGGGAAGKSPVFASLETEWTPLTRIREEHAPMPAPETKCMQVFGGVHNYKTKMCEVYERLSQVCVQVHVDEAKGRMYFASQEEGGGGGGGGGGGSGDGSGGGGEDDEEEEKVARYGCDPRSSWSPWSYTVLTVEGRTVLDVVSPPAVDFAETLLTFRSDLDPFLHAEALTYSPGGGGYGGGGGGAGSGGGGGGGASGGGGGAGSGGGGGEGEVQQSDGRAGSGFLTFGLSSWSSAVVGFAFLGVGLLLLVQPMFALRRWWRNTAGMGGRGGGGGGAGSGRRGRGRGEFRYGQLETEWAEGSEVSDGMYAEEGDWYSEGEWQGEEPSGVDVPSLSFELDEGDHGSLTPDALRRRMSDAVAIGGGSGSAGGSGGGREEDGIQLGPITRSGRGVEATLL